MITILVLIGSSSEITPIIITFITAVFLAMAWMHKGIYENRLNDLIEAFFLVNLCIFAVSTYHQNISLIQARVGYVFVGLALAIYGCTVLYHNYLAFKKYCSKSEKKDQDMPLDAAGHDRQQGFSLKPVSLTQTFVDL